VIIFLFRGDEAHLMKMLQPV